MALFDFLKKKEAPATSAPPTPSTPSNNDGLTILTHTTLEEVTNLMINGTQTSVHNPQVALKFGEYYNSINKVSNSIATLSRNFFDQDKKLTEKEYNNVFHWKKMMSPGITSAKMLKAWVTNMLKGGNGYLIVTRDKNYNIEKYTLKEWTKMKPFKFEGEPWYYDIETGEVYNWYNVLHLADIINDELEGITKVRHYSEALGKSKASSEFFNKYFNAGLFLSAHLGYPLNAMIDEKDQPRIEQMVRDNFGGVGKSSKVLVTTQGAEIKQFKTDIPLSDTQWLENEKTTKEDIRGAFGIPEDLSTEGGRTEYMENAVLPIVQQIEGEVNTKVVEINNQDNIKFKFEVESLLRADSKTKSEVIQTNLRNSIYTINEARALYNLPPIQGGDVPMVMANNMVPLEQLEEFVNSKMK